MMGYHASILYTCPNTILSPYHLSPYCPHHDEGHTYLLLSRLTYVTRLNKSVYITT